MKNRVGLLLAINIGMFLLVVILECLSVTGLTLHEWIGFALCPVALVHVVLQSPWPAAQPRRILAPGALRTRINCALNIVLLILVAGTLISGVLSSHQLVPIVGESLGRTYVWVWVHDSLNKPMLSVIGLHLALNWNWLVAAIRKRSPSPPTASSSRPGVGLVRFVLGGAGVL